jgi:hypothetical protein
MRCLVVYPALPQDHRGRSIISDTGGGNNSGSGGGKKNQLDNIINLPEETPQEALDRTCKTAQTLKDAMLTYPGKIDFKDADKSGFSPLDYAIDGNVENEELIKILIRRKEVKGGKRNRRSISLRRGIRSLSGRSVCSAASLGSSCAEQDIDIVCQLEADVIEARRHRIEKIKAKRREEEAMKKKEAAFLDVFGIEEHQSRPSSGDLAAETPTSVISCSPTPSKPSLTSKASKVLEAIDEPPLAGGGMSAGRKGSQEGLRRRSRTSEDIINQHLEDYLNDYMDDFEGLGEVEYFEGLAEDGGFDIFEDPEENMVPIFEIVVDDIDQPRFDDDTASMVSDVTVCTLASRR